MSAILNALRKLETESNSLRPWSAHIRSANGRNRSLKRLFLFSTGLPLSILVFTAGFLYYRKPAFVINFFNSMVAIENPTKPLTNTSIPIFSEKPMVSSTRPAPKKAGKTTRPSVASNRTSPPINPQALNARLEPMALSTQNEKPTGARTPEANINLARKGTELRAHQFSPPAAKQLKPAKPLVKKIPKKEASVPVAIYNDPSMILQAIAWSKDPKERMTVINGEILREGESIEGFTIKGIREDTIIIRQGNKHMRLVFRFQ